MRRGCLLLTGLLALTTCYDDRLRVGGSRAPTANVLVASSGVALPKLKVQGATFRDPAGRVVFLRGANYSHRTKSKPHVSWQKPEHFAQMRAWGFNCVRYLLQWDAIEPEPGMFDEAYLDHVEKAIQWAAAEGLYVLLDMHQDLYASIFGGDGAAAWAAVDNLNNPNIFLQPWYLTYFTPEVRASFDRLWTDTKLQDHFCASWAEVAKRAKTYAHVVGYDLFNEPFPGNETPWSFEHVKLSAFYAKVATAIRQADPGAILFVEPAAVTANAGLPTGLQPLEGPVVYAPHYYDPIIMFGGPHMGPWPAKIAFGVMNVQASSFGAPLFIGEFGTFRERPDAAQILRDQCGVMDEMLLAGWTYWDYNPDLSTNTLLEVDTLALTDAQGKEHPGMSAVVRPYARAVAGDPVAMSFDLSTHTFTLTLQNAKLFLPTVLYLPPRHYPTVTVTAPGPWKHDPSSGTLTYWAVSSQEQTIIVRP